MTVLSPALVFRKYETDGVPSSGAHDPKKAEIVQLLEHMSDAGGAKYSVATLTELNAITPTAGEHPRGEVLDDATATNNGWYTWDSDATAWVFERGFPDSVAVLTDIGGTASAITASTAAGVDPSIVQMLLLPDPPGTNTSSTVTITLNGGSAENIKAASGAALAIGDIIDGVGTLFFRFGSEWRQLFSSRTGATFDHQGTYASGTTYTEGQVVTGSDGNWYQLKAASATGDDPVSGGSGDWLEILSGVAIADGSITEPKYATGSVSARAIAAGAATLAKIGDDAKADFRLVGPSLSAPLDPVYYTKTQVMFNRLDEIAMCGHFFKGQWENARGTVFAAPAEDIPGQVIRSLGNGNSTQGDLLYEAWASLDVWYNMFAVANDGDATLDYKFTPSICVGAVDTGTGVITFNASGENDYPHTTPTAKTFQFATDSLIGVRVLLITATVAGRAGAWCGRKATITANTGTTITLDDAGDVTVGDFFLLLPSNYDHYCWLFDIYGEDNLDTTISIRNIGTRGNGERMAYMVNLMNELPAAGVSVPGPPGTKIHWGGNVSPLARSLIADPSFVFNVGASGNYAEYYDSDGGGHVTASIYGQKTQTTIAETEPWRQVKIAGSYGPYFYFKNGGNQVGNVQSHQIFVNGWIY